jgi:hypothetical protein
MTHGKDKAAHLPALPQVPTHAADQLYGTLLPQRRLEDAVGLSALRLEHHFTLQPFLHELR